MSWVSEHAQTFEQTFALRDNLYRDYRAFEAVFSEHRLLDETLMRLCKTRVAQLHRCPAQIQALREQLPANRFEALSQWYRSPEFSALEKAALQLTECFCLDPHSISDDMTEAVKANIGDAGLVALLEYLALCDGFVRFQVILETGASV